MAERTYLDWNATAPLRPEARAAAIEALSVCGNPSSVHAEGRAARRQIEAARESLAALLGAEPRNVVFTASGTEANMMALCPSWGHGDGSQPLDALVISAIEHPSVLAGGRFPRTAVEIAPVAADGRLDLGAFERLVRALAARDRRVLASIMLANNETGLIQPVAQIAAVAHAAGALLHVDAVQALGRMPCDINELQADLLTVSGHKIGAPKGVGALVRRDPGLQLADPLVKGGGQERGARAGTENVAAIAAFGAAAATVVRQVLGGESARMAALRDRLEAGLKGLLPGVVIFGAEADRLPNTTLFVVPGIRAETAVIALDLEGFAVSSGAACSSGKVQPSHVLAAMGVAPALAQGAIRLSLGATTTESEVDRFLDAWIRLSKALAKEADGIAA